jgi:hypothetical protein
MGIFLLGVEQALVEGIAEEVRGKCVDNYRKSHRIGAHIS